MTERNLREAGGALRSPCPAKSREVGRRKAKSLMFCGGRTGMILAMKNFEIFLFFCLQVSVHVLGAMQGKDRTEG